MHLKSTLSDEVIVSLAQLSYTKLVILCCTDAFFPLPPPLFFICLLFHFSGSVLSAEFLLTSRLCSPCLCLLSVSLVKSKLDPESLGIILLGPFLLEFFPDQVYVCESVSGNQLSLQKIQCMTHAFHISHDPYHG